MTRAAPVTESQTNKLTDRIIRFELVLTSGGLAALLALSHTVTDAVMGTFSALLPSFQGRFGLSEATLALLVA